MPDSKWTRPLVTAALLLLPAVLGGAPLAWGSPADGLPTCEPDGDAIQPTGRTTPEWLAAAALAAELPLPTRCVGSSYHAASGGRSLDGDMYWVTVPAGTLLRVTVESVLEGDQGVLPGISLWNEAIENFQTYDVAVPTAAATREYHHWAGIATEAHETTRVLLMVTARPLTDGLVADYVLTLAPVAGGVVESGRGSVLVTTSVPLYSSASPTHALSLQESGDGTNNAVETAWFVLDEPGDGTAAFDLAYWSGLAVDTDVSATAHPTILFSAPNATLNAVYPFTTDGHYDPLASTLPKHVWGHACTAVVERDHGAVRCMVPPGVTKIGIQAKRQDTREPHTVGVSEGPSVTVDEGDVRFYNGPLHFTFDILR